MKHPAAMFRKGTRLAASVYTVETAIVYRAGGQRYFSRSAAIKRYARDVFFRKHPCLCEQEEYSSGYPGFYCGHHERWQKVMPRYVRLIRKALKRANTPHDDDESRPGEPLTSRRNTK